MQGGESFADVLQWLQQQTDTSRLQMQARRARWITRITNYSCTTQAASCVPLVQESCSWLLRTQPFEHIFVGTCVQVCLDVVERIFFKCALCLGEDWGADDLNGMEGPSGKAAS